MDKKHAKGLQSISVLCICLLCMSIVSLPLKSFAENFSIHTLLNQFSETPSFTVKFKQQRFMSFSDKPVVTTGVMRYRAPDYMEQHTLVPKEQRVILEGDHATIIQAGQTKRQVNIQQYPVGYIPLYSLSKLMTADIDALQAMYDIQLIGHESHWTIRLMPKDAALKRQIHYIDLGGIRQSVKQFVVAQPNRQRIVVDFYE